MLGFGFIQGVASTAGSEATRSYTVMDWVNISFGIAGLIGTLYGILSWRAGKKTENVYKHLFDLAEKNIDRSVTEKQLQERKEELKTASERIGSLQEKIRRDIPMEARRAVLRDRIYSQTESIAKQYEAVMSMEAELSSLGEIVEFPAELRRSIEAQIIPDYRIRQRQFNLQTYLSIITASAGIASAVLPHPLNRLLPIAILVLGIPILILLLRALWLHNKKMSPRFVGQVVLVAGGACALVALSISGICFAVAAAESGSRPDSVIAGVVMLIISLGLAWVVFFQGKKRGFFRRKDQPNRNEVPDVRAASNPTAPADQKAPLSGR